MHNNRLPLQCIVFYQHKWVVSSSFIPREKQKINNAMMKPVMSRPCLRSLTQNMAAMFCERETIVIYPICINISRNYRNNHTLFAIVSMHASWCSQIWYFYPRILTFLKIIWAIFTCIVCDEIYTARRKRYAHDTFRLEALLVQTQCGIPHLRVH